MLATKDEPCCHHVGAGWTYLKHKILTHGSPFHCQHVWKNLEMYRNGEAKGDPDFDRVLAFVLYWRLSQ